MLGYKNVNGKFYCKLPDARGGPPHLQLKVDALK